MEVKLLCRQRGLPFDFARCVAEVGLADVDVAPPEVPDGRRLLRHWRRSAEEQQHRVRLDPLEAGHCRPACNRRLEEACVEVHVTGKVKVMEAESRRLAGDDGYRNTE